MRQHKQQGPLPNRVASMAGVSFLFLLLLFFSPGSTFSDQTRVRNESATIKWFLKNPYYRNLYKSFAIGIVKNDALVFQYYEESDSEKLYGLASITKMFTATAVMQLVQQGKISLEDPVSDFFPGLVIERKDLGSKPVKIKHLLSHSAGLPDLRYYKTEGWLSVSESKFRVPLQIYPTGTHYRYANQGFMLLGEIISLVSKKSLADYFRDEIFIPLGMRHTRTTLWLTGAGGITTTLPDLAKFAGAYLSDANKTRGYRLLSAKSIQMMTDSHSYVSSATNVEYCGLGWRIRKSGNKVLQMFHIGGANGVAAWIQMFPEEQMAILYLGDPPGYSDRTMAFLSRLQDRLMSLAIAVSGDETELHPFQPDLADAKQQHRFSGVYARRPDKKIVRIKQGKESLILEEMNVSDAKEFEIYPAGFLSMRGGPEYLRMDFIDWNGRMIIGLAREDGYYDKVSDDTFWPVVPFVEEEISGVVKD